MSVSNLEQFVERAETAGKRHQRVGAHREVQLADREVVKLKGQIRRRIGIGLLFVRQADIKSDRGRAGVGRAAICRFHDAGSAARRDDIVADAVVRNERTAALRGDLAEEPRFVVPPRRTIGGSRRGVGRRPHARAAEHHDGRSTVQARSRSSAFAYSSCKRTPRMESPSRKSGSSAARRNAGEFFCALLSAIALTTYGFDEVRIGQRGRSTGGTARPPR